MLKYGIDIQLLDTHKILSLLHITIYYPFYCLYKISKKKKIKIYIDWTVYFWQKFQDIIKSMTATPLSAEWFISHPDIFYSRLKLLIWSEFSKVKCI